MSGILQVLNYTGNAAIGHLKRKTLTTHLDKAADLGRDLFPDRTRKKVSVTPGVFANEGVCGWLVSLLLVGRLPAPSVSSKYALAFSKDAGVKLDSFLVSSLRVVCTGSSETAAMSVVTTVARDEVPSPFAAGDVIVLASSSSSML